MRKTLPENVKSEAIFHFTGRHFRDIFSLLGRVHQSRIHIYSGFTQKITPFNLFFNPFIFFLKSPNLFTFKQSTQSIYKVKVLQWNAGIPAENLQSVRLSKGRCEERYALSPSLPELLLPVHRTRHVSHSTFRVGLVLNSSSISCWSLS